MATIYKRNDTRPILELALQEDGAPLDLTDVTDAALLLNDGEGGQFEIPCDITVPATGGMLTAELDATVTAEETTFQGEVQLTYNDGGIETVPNHGYIEIQVEADLGP